jgi:hypothetical protein
MTLIICGIVAAVVTYIGLVFSAASCTAPSRFGWRDGTRVMVGTFVTAAICIVGCWLIADQSGLLGAAIGAAIPCVRLVVKEIWNHTNHFCQLLPRYYDPPIQFAFAEQFDIDRGHDSKKVVEQRWQEIRNKKTLRFGRFGKGEAEILEIKENVENFPLVIKVKFNDNGAEKIFDIYYEENSAASCKRNKQRNS